MTRIATKLLEFTEVLLRTVDVVDEKDTNRTTSESAFRLLEVSGQVGVATFVGEEFPLN